MDMKTMRRLGWRVTGIAVCLMASSCRTSFDTQPDTGEKTVAEGYGGCAEAEQIVADDSEDVYRFLIAHVEMQLVAFQAKDIEKLLLAGGVSEASLMALWRAGKAKLVATVSAITEENQETIVKAAQEVLYPSEWSLVAANAGEPGAKQPSRSPKAGAFFEPQNFTMREAGLILQVIPQGASADGSLMKMSLRPQWTRLERWEPLLAVGLTADGKRQTLPLNQPVFSVTSFETHVCVRIGETTLIGTASTSDGKWVHAGFLTVKRVRVVGESSKVPEF